MNLILKYSPLLSSSLKFHYICLFDTLKWLYSYCTNNHIRRMSVSNVDTEKFHSMTKWIETKVKLKQKLKLVSSIKAIFLFVIVLRQKLLLFTIIKSPKTISVLYGILYNLFVIFHFITTIHFTVLLSYSTCCFVC